ncbi:TPA: hypothetical protein L9K80_003286 [Klebsiella quasipneumoniae subsp. similipneumoniae]|nr:hypothetical protein [Klebsiella quasipneumoniae subsp. similipneumoniae]
MSLLELIESKKVHIARYSSENGMLGERSLLDSQALWIKRPKGKDMKNLLAALKQYEGIEIKASSFDFISIPENISVDFDDVSSLAGILKSLTFIELKTCNQKRVTNPDFRNFFFAITENEIVASELLGNRHIVVLHNKITGDKLVTTIPEIINRANSKNWQLSISLGSKEV